MSFEERIEQKIFTYLEEQEKEGNLPNPVFLAREFNLDKITSERYVIKYVNRRDDLLLNLALVSDIKTLTHEDVTKVGKIARMSVSKKHG